MRPMRTWLRTPAPHFCFHLDTREPPPILGGDDASEALWVPISEISRLEDSFFEDHFLVLADVLSGVEYG